MTSDKFDKLKFDGENKLSFSPSNFNLFLDIKLDLAYNNFAGQELAI